MEQQEEGEEAVGAAAAAAAAVDNSSDSGKSKGLSLDDFLLAKLKMRDTNVAAIKKVLEESTLKGPVARVEMRVFGALRAIDADRLDLLDFFLDECKVAVNTLSEDETCCIESGVLASNSYLETCICHTPLAFVLDFGGTDEVKPYLLDRIEKKEVDTRTSDGRTCLMVAAKFAQFEDVKRLVLEFHADVDAQCDEGHTALCYALKGEEFGIKTDIGEKGATDFLLEHARAQGGDERRQALIKNPCTCKPGFHMVFHAIDAHDGDFRDLKPLIEYLFEKEGKDEILYNTFTPASAAQGVPCLPLQYAASYSNLDDGILQWFFAQGVPVDLATPDFKLTTLHASAFIADEQRSMKVVRYLIEVQHANPTLRTASGKTAADLHYFPAIKAYLRGKERWVKAQAKRQAKREEEARQAIRGVDLEKASAAANAAAAALLADLEAEEAAAKATSDKKGKEKEKEKTKNKNKNKNKNRNDRQEKSETEKIEEESEGTLASTLENLRITEATATTTPPAAAAATSAAATTPTKEAITVSTTSAAAATIATEDEEDNDGQGAFQDFLLENAPDTLICPISHALFREAVIAQDERTYEKANLEEWIASCCRKGNPLTSPITGAVMAPGFVRSQGIRIMVMEYIEKKTQEWEKTGGGKKKG